MNKSLRRRVAAVATTATVGGLLLPFLAAGSALAAEPTGVTVSPVAQTAPVGSSPTITATLTGGTGAPTFGVYYRVTAGPDVTTGNAGTPCAQAGSSYTCSIPPAGHPNTVAGTDSIQVFYDAANNGGIFQNQDPAAAASVTFAGKATRTFVTPTTVRTSTNSTASYTVSGTDVNGNPASGPVDVRISQTIPTSADPLIFTDPTNTLFPAVTNGVTTPSSSSSGTNTTYTDTQTFNFANGAVNFGVASSAAGTVTVSGGVNSTSLSAGSASLAVSAGNTAAGPSTRPNDDNAAALTPAPNSNSFSGMTVTNVVTIKNTSGDPLGGVSVLGLVTSGPSKGTSTATPAFTDQLGHATLTYSASAASGTDTLLAWVNQDTHVPNTLAADPGEPQGTTSVTLSTEPANLALTSDKDTQTPVATTQTSTPVTYTLKSGANPAPGLTVNFTIGAASTAGKAFTVTPASAVTDSNGLIAVTVSNPAPAAGDKIVVVATLAGDATVADNKVELDYSAATATGLSVIPTKQSLAAGSQVTETATLVDQFGKPVSGATIAFAVIGRNGPATNSNSTASVTTDAAGTAAFTYSDVGTAVTVGNMGTAVDVVSVKVSSSPAIAAKNATVNFVPGTATTAKLIFVAPAFSAFTTGTTANPVAGNSPTTVTAITAQPTDSANNTLFNKTVKFTSTGVGSFTDSKGNPVGSSTTAQVDGSGVATVYVRSASPGTETVFASADQVSSSADAASSSADRVTGTYTSGYVGISPKRVVDTRSGQGSLTAVGGGIAPQRLAPNTNYTFNLAATDLPQSQAAYAFNVTAIGANQVGNLRIAATCGTSTPTPDTSLIGYQPGADVANFVVVSTNSNGATCNSFDIYSDGSGVSVAIDAVGYYSNANAPSIMANIPSRIVDTRTGLGGSNGPLAAGSRHFFRVAPAVAPGATQPVKAVALNVTAINPSGLGYLQVYPDGATQSTASNINYIPGVDKAAFVIVNVPANGLIDVYSAGSSAGLAIDLFASFPSTSTLVTSAPVRVLDTRLTANTISGNGTLNVQVTGAAGVPADAQAVLISLTAIHTAGGTGIGNLRAYPAGGALPTVSTVNYVSSTSDVANFAIVKLGTNGQVSLYSDGSPIDAAVDVVGYVPAG